MSKKRARTTGRADLRQADYLRLAQFRYLLRQFLLFSEDAAEQADLTPQQHQALLAIKGHAGSDPLTTGVLAERLALRHHSTVGLVDRLAAKGFVRRRQGSIDRRQVLLDLTPKAEALLQDLSVAHRDELKRIGPLLRGLLAEFENDKP